MRPCELPLTCFYCCLPADYYDSIPDASKEGYTRSEAGYKLISLCWLHAVARRKIATSRVSGLLRCEKEGIARVDRDKADGSCVCQDCGRTYYNHSVNVEYNFLHQLCDGSVVKL